MDVITILRPENKILPGKRKKSRNPAASLNIKSRGFSFKKLRAAFASKPASSTVASADFSVGSFAAIPSFSEKNFQKGHTFHHRRSFFSASACSVPDLDSFSDPGIKPYFSGSVFVFDNRAAKAAFAVGSFPLLGGFIPLLVILSAALCLLAPAFQGHFGFYFLEKKISFDSDGAAYSAMNSLLNSGENFSGAEAALIRGESAESPMFNIAAPVTYSTYTVRGGDTISGIAARFGLDNISTILSVNEIENARRIRTGQTLRIPSIDGVLYKVAAGDSLASIASKFNVPLTVILDANDLADSFIAVGQEIFIPGARLSSYDLKKAMGELFIYPIHGRLTSRYGTRADPFTGVKSFHTGVDLAASTGTSVKASTDGRVAAAGWQNIYGNYVIVTHAGGYQTLYAHMSSISVQRGQYLTQGDEVGKVGSTGYSTGPHLHFSVYKDGKTIDPFSVLD